MSFLEKIASKILTNYLGEFVEGKCSFYREWINNRSAKFNYLLRKILI